MYMNKIAMLVLLSLTLVSCGAEISKEDWVKIDGWDMWSFEVSEKGWVKVDVWDFWEVWEVFVEEFQKELIKELKSDDSEGENKKKWWKTAEEAITQFYKWREICDTSYMNNYSNLTEYIRALRYNFADYVKDCRNDHLTDKEYEYEIINTEIIDDENQEITVKEYNSVKGEYETTIYDVVKANNEWKINF